MWIVAKIKNNNSEIFKNELSKKTSKKDIIFTNQNMLTNYIQKEKKLKKQNHC